MSPRRRQHLVRLVVVGVVVLALGGCRPATSSAPASSTVPFAPASIDAEAGEYAPGHLLIELVPGIAMLESREKTTATALGAQHAAAASGEDEDGSAYRVGDVELILIRQIAPASTSLGREPDSGPIFLFRLLQKDSDGKATLEALRRVATDARVRRVELDHVRRIAAQPNDPLLGEQWGLAAIRAPEAWDIGIGSTSVVVGILDTGIVPHPDLIDRLVPGYDFITNPESADDGDNRRDADPTDTGGVESSRLHGTHVAGIIGATANNYLGIAGVDLRCRLMPVRVLGVRGGDGVDSDIADGVRWAAGLQVGKLPLPAHPADVLNLSFGGPTVSFTLQRAIDQAIERGVLIVVAAGNGGVDARTFSPGGLDRVISVGASGKNGSRADYSNYGPRVDLLAPGGDGSVDEDAGVAEGILSTYRDEGRFENPAAPLFSYYPLTGTSQAAPHVAGAASLARALWPGLRQSGLSALLNVSANSKSRCDRDTLMGCGAGLLDVQALLTRARDQLHCGCSDGKICLDGMTCVDPPSLHAPHFQDNTLHSGCGMTGSQRQNSDGMWSLVLLALVLCAGAGAARRIGRGTRITEGSLHG